MNAKRSFTLITTTTTLLSVVLAACSPAATPAAPPLIVQATQSSVEQYARPTQAPMRTMVVQEIVPAQPDASGGLFYATQVPQDSYWPTPAATPDTMIFQDYGVNPFIDASEDKLSTFAIDVDTASYTLMRGYIERGTLPPADAVRVEEYVNRPCCA